MMMSHLWWFTFSTPATEVTVVWPQISHFQSADPLIPLFRHYSSVCSRSLGLFSSVSRIPWAFFCDWWFQATQIFLAYSLFHLQVQATLSFLNLHLEVSYVRIHINFTNVRQFPHWTILYFILHSLSFFFALISCHWIVLRRHKLMRESCWTEVTEREWVLLGFERPHSVCTTVLKTSLSVANKVPEVLALGKYLEK